MSDQKRVRMRALMSLPKAANRKAVPRGGEFDATPQERLDLLQMARAEDVKPVPASKAAADDKK